MGIEEREVDMHESGDLDNQRSIVLKKNLKLAAPPTPYQWIGEI